MNAAHPPRITALPAESIPSPSNSDATAAAIPAAKGRGWLAIFDSAGVIVVLAAAGLWVCRAVSTGSAGPHAEAGPGAQIPASAPAAVPASPAERNEADAAPASHDFVLIHSGQQRPVNPVAGR